MDQYWLGHRERLRSRVRRNGLETLRPHEIVELVLFNVVPRADVSMTARALLQRFGSTAGLFSATEEELAQVPGVTKRMARWIRITGELIDAYADISRRDLLTISCYREVVEYLEPRWKAVSAPACQALYIDYDQRLISCGPTADSVDWNKAIHARKIIEEGLILQAKYLIILVFFGDEPQEFDNEKNKYLRFLGRVIKPMAIGMLDCVLVGNGKFRSMNAEGFMEAVREDSGARMLHEAYCGERPNENRIDFGDGDDEQDRAIYEGEPDAL